MQQTGMHAFVVELQRQYLLCLRISHVLKINSFSHAALPIPFPYLLLHIMWPSQLSEYSGYDFATNAFKGGYLGELIQWSDLISVSWVTKAPSWLSHNLFLGPSLAGAQDYYCSIKKAAVRPCLTWWYYFHLHHCLLHFSLKIQILCLICCSLITWACMVSIRLTLWHRTSVEFVSLTHLGLNQNVCYHLAITHIQREKLFFRLIDSFRTKGFQVDHKNFAFSSWGFEVE